jgi:ABC-type Mn2+/Zn2+ transport system ATPase subunit
MILLSPTSYPQRVPIDTSRMNTWPFSHRQVYNLSTGQYSEQDIARMLRYPPKDLLTIFKELERLEVLIRGF